MCASDDHAIIRKNYELTNTKGSEFKSTWRFILTTTISLEFFTILTGRNFAFYLLDTCALVYKRV